MRPTIEEVREAVQVLFVDRALNAEQTNALLAALDAAVALAEWAVEEHPRTLKMRGMAEAFHATIATSPGATSDDNR